MSVIRPELHTSLATQLLYDVQFLRTNLYYYLGKIEPWADETIPPLTPPATVESDIETRNNIVFMKKISPVDVSIVIPRYSWESGIVFDEWDHTQLMQDSTFYCVTDDFNVYKCLNNNIGAASTVKPTGTAVVPFQTADGYLWKYMYNIPQFKQLKFVSREYIPVQTALTDSFYNKGAIEQVAVYEGGSDYTDSLQTTIAITDAAGSGAILIPSVSRSTGTITKVTIVNGGEDYSDPELEVVQFPSTGTGLYNNNPSAILKAIVQDGVIVNVTIEDPGQDYPADVDTTIVVQGDGEGAEFTPVVYEGGIIDVIVDDPGLNYSTITLSVVGNGSGARLGGIIGASDFLSDQSIIEQIAVPGAIYNVKVSNGGNNYTGTTTVQITGDGQGATATAVIGPGGVIQKVVMTSFGTGYSRATISFNDVNRLGGEGFVDAQAYAILPPIMGHGSNPVKELYGRTALIYTLIKDETQMTLLNQDYRQFGLIENPLNLISNQRTQNSSTVVTFEALLVDSAGLLPDAMLVSNNVRYRVVSINGNVVKMQQMSPIYKQPGSLFTLEAAPYTDYSVTRILQAPTVNKYSGNLMYVTNNPPLIATEDQAFAIRTYIRL